MRLRASTQLLSLALRSDGVDPAAEAGGRVVRWLSYLGFLCCFGSIFPGENRAPPPVGAISHTSSGEVHTSSTDVGDELPKDGDFTCLKAGEVF
jgi:hypothetical protein